MSVLCKDVGSHYTCQRYRFPLGTLVWKVSQILCNPRCDAYPPIIINDYTGIYRNSFHSFLTPEKNTNSASILPFINLDVVHLEYRNGGNWDLWDNAAYKCLIIVRVLLLKHWQLLSIEGQIDRAMDINRLVAWNTAIYKESKSFGSNVMSDWQIMKALLENDGYCHKTYGWTVAYL